MSLRSFRRQGALLAASLIACRASAERQRATELRRYDAPEATQAVAVDEQSFYAIGNQVVAKYSKTNGTQLAAWKASDSQPLIHLNSGVVIDGRLYCAHSNYPHQPAASSVEIWSVEPLRHVDSHSFGIAEGSLTWIDRRDGAWWGVFAHYTKKTGETPAVKDSRWTSLVKFDDQWRPVAAWAFPDDVLAEFGQYSCSGGAWRRDGGLYCTGHDRGEIYQLALPSAGTSLKLVKTLAVPITGQGFAWDPADSSILYGIDRPARQVVAARLGATAEPSARQRP